MITFYKNLLRLCMALSCLYAPNLMADLSGSPATILLEATKTVMGVGEENNIYVTVSNPTGSAISGIVVAVTIPAGFTVNSTVVPTGTTFPNPYTTWTFTSSLAANTSKTLIIRVTYNGSNGVIVAPSGTFNAGSTGSSEIDILIGCPYINWGGNNPIEINNRNIVQFNNTTVVYSQNLAPQGVNAVFNGFRKNVNPPVGYPEYTARFQNLNITNLGWILQFNNANPQSDPSGNNPYQMVNPLTGVIDPMAVTDDPPNYLEGKFIFDATTYPNGLNGISFFIYDIDAQRTKGWQDAVIVFGTDINGNQVAPITQYSAITTVYDVNNIPYSVSIGGKCSGTDTGLNCLVNYDADNPRGRVTYLFPQALRSVDIRYFRNSQINSEHFVWLSNLYRGCGTDLALRIAVEDAYVCEQCFTYTVTAQNNGPSDVLLAQVTGVVPAGLTVTNATPSKGTFDSGTGTWTIGSLMVNEIATLVVHACASQESITFDMLLLGDGDQTVPGDNEVHKTISVSYIIVQDDMATTLENTPVLINWAANDSSVGGTLDLGSFAVIPPLTTDGVVVVDSPGVIKFTPNLGFVGTAEVHYQVADSNGCTGTAKITIMVAQSSILPPTALNDSAITPINTSVDIAILNNDLTGSAPLNPSTITIITPPNNGTITNINVFTGAITYKPNLGFIGTDNLVYQVCDTFGQCAQANVYVTVFDPNAPCPHVCPAECCGGCFDAVIECLCTPVSHSHFFQLDGIWTQVGDHENTVANGTFANFLRYNIPVNQAFHVMECEIEVPSPQLPSQPDCRVGLITHWNGSHSNISGPSIAFFNFATDGAGNITGTPTFKVDTHLVNTPTSVNFPLVLGQNYKVTLVKFGQQTVVLIDDIFVLYDPNSGSVPGNFIGTWAYKAEGNFKNLTSCSYRTIPPQLHI